MKYKSNNKSIERALNKTWLLIGVPFFGLMIGTSIWGFYLMDKYDIGGVYPLIVIFGAILIPTMVCHQISKVWFSVQLKKVSDKVEFIERAKRLQMIWPSTADKIALRQGIIQIERESEKNESLPYLLIQEGLILTNEFLELKGKKYKWIDIKDFQITATGYESYTRSKLMLIFKDNRFVIERYSFKNGSEIDYEIDRYLNNTRTNHNTI